MSTTTETLYELQGLLRSSKAPAATRESRIAELRPAVPAPILAHFDRLIAQGRNAVALVRRGVCGECHLRVSASTAASLARPDDIFVCEYCGCYLMRAPEESVAVPPPPAPAKSPAKAPGRPRRKKPVATAV